VELTDVNIAEKHRWSNFLNTASQNHILIQGASANNLTQRWAFQKQMDYKFLFLYGGLEDGELATWLTTHKNIPNDKLPFFSMMTGNIPLYMNSFKILPNQQFNDALNTFTKTDENVQLLRKNLHTFSSNVSFDERNEHLEMMSKFVAEMDVQINDHALYDHGAFYVDSTGIGRCVNGLARSFAVFLLREARADVFVDKPMLDQLKVVTNTSVKGFLVENVVITFIKLGGLVVDGYRLGAKGAGAKCITFARGSENQVIVSNSSSNIKETMETFFFPCTMELSLS